MKKYLKKSGENIINVINERSTDSTVMQKGNGEEGMSVNSANLHLGFIRE